MTRLDLDPAPARIGMRPTLARLALLGLVVLGTLWGFNKHFENVATRLQAQEAITDETGQLPPERLALLREASDALREAYGVQLSIVARPGPVSAPPPNPKTLFIGLDTASNAAVVQLPPLLAKALPPELAQSLASGYFDAYLAAGAWPEGLYTGVLAILEALRDQR
ncbi:hypothetical protein [Fundidesulfovibrio soli]|uniref:hypothetical protein n=1 Tax=Fundidesulfovibrio soli TaxID=2922716 RepID=UPI001FAF9FAD|nr:hypothetical protein [Fundidesulfovibrio soli]